MSWAWLMQSLGARKQGGGEHIVIHLPPGTPDNGASLAFGSIMLLAVYWGLQLRVSQSACVGPS